MNALTQCFLCRDCEGAAYGWPPILYTGSLDSPVLVIAQNPGDFHSAIDKERYAWQTSTKEEFDTLEQSGVLNTPFGESFIYGAYRTDFGNSSGAKQLARVFGSTWLDQCCYTNAVLCRTPNNDSPSNQMIENCRKWTLELIESHPRKLIVAVGAIAKNQIIPISQNHRSLGKMLWGIPRQLKSGRIILPILHYSAWRHQPASIVDDYREAFSACIDLLDIPYSLD